jgi:tyrosinase
MVNMVQTILHGHVQDFVSGIDDAHPDKKNYAAAAKTFRLPYWDWARRGQSSIFPQAALENKYDRKSVPKSSKSWFEKNPVYNPLFQYPFPEGSDRKITRVSHLLCFIICINLVPPTRCF